MRLRIRAITPASGSASDMTGKDVVVEDADTGRKLSGVQAVSWECAGRHEKPLCILTLHNVLVDLSVAVDDAQAAVVRLLDQAD